MTAMTTLTADDEQQIHELWDAMARSWAAGDAASFAANFSETCDFTTVRGEKPPGRDGIAAGHDRLFRTAYRGTVLRARVTGIRALRPDLATVNAESTIVGADGTPLVSTHALAVVERTASTGGWRITAFHNMVPVAAAGGR
ncbi:SgcJ/EcaC family oxidoreductase [Streptomyces sp. NPDC051776]|uniref:SgcJ/EcaC family oxidoreductase n=1 Tax=Streptomyces sp. NPDC051776 TaxID=3155414 RepID=UPI003414CE60